jgi:magnesium transporter
MKEIIDKFHIEDINNPIHPSVFFQHELYDLFILRLPQTSKENELEYKSKVFVITDDDYLRYDRESEEFISINNIKGFYAFIDKYVNNTLKTVQKYSDELESIEDIIYQGKVIKEFNKRWFMLKNDLVRIGRVLLKAVETISNLIKVYKKEEEYLERNFEDLFEHIQRAYRNSEHLLEKLDAIYNFNLNQSNDQMNRIVYILTLLSGIFLPLNLIVGFFGMNTTSLPFTQGEGGTYNVIILLGMMGLMATLLTLFMKKR